MKHLIFDYNGTLNKDLHHTYDVCMKIFEKFGMKPVTIDQFKKDLEFPYMNFWSKVFERANKVLPMKEEIDALYFALEEEVHEPNLYEGVNTTLGKFYQSKIDMVVVSTFPHERLVEQLQHHTIHMYFKEIEGSVYDKCEIIHKTIERNNFAIEQTLFIGDSVHDIEAGKHAGVSTAAITWGYATEEALVEARPDYIIKTIEELLHIVK